MLTGAKPYNIVVLIILVNGAAFFLFAEDKRRAGAGLWRISELALLFCAMIGPFGALAAMQVFHHKTQKRKFFLVPLFCLLQVLAIIWQVPGLF